MLKGVIARIKAAWSTVSSGHGGTGVSLTAMHIVAIIFIDLHGLLEVLNGLGI